MIKLLESAHETTAKACPTVYNGVRMRSRTEARYAAWIDPYFAWDYEPFAFASGEYQWRFDFLLHAVNAPESPTPRDVFVELKPGRWWKTAPPYMRDKLLAQVRTTFHSDSAALCILEQSGHPGRPLIIGPDEVRFGLWALGSDGCPALVTPDRYATRWGDAHLLQAAA